MSVNRFALASFLLVAAAPAVAETTAPTDLQIHGFLSQGWVLSQGNNVNGESDDSSGSGEFRELGANFSYRPMGSLLLAAQMAAVEHGKATDEDMVLDYGLVDYTAVADARGRFGLRAGRLKLPIGLYNDSRDVVFTRPGITLPESVYLETSGGRSFGYFSSDGAGLYGDWLVGEHALYLEGLYAAGQELDDSAEIAILRTLAPSGRFEVDQGVVARLMDEYDGGRWRAALSVLTSQLRYQMHATPTAAEPFNQSGNFDFDQAVLSLQRNSERWSITAEIVARHLEVDDLSGPPFPQSPFINEVKQDPAGWYLQAAWRMTPKWQWLARYDEQIRDWNDRHGYEQERNSRALSGIAAMAGVPLPVQPRHYYFARDAMVGTRYDVLPNVALWAEFHYVDGAGWVNPSDNTPDFLAGRADRYWNFFTVMAGLRF
jgi:hypothetical protein